MADSIFALFLGFSVFWIALGIGAIVYLSNQEKQSFNIGKEGLIVALSVLIPFFAALVIGSFYF